MRLIESPTIFLYVQDVKKISSGECQNENVCHMFAICRFSWVVLYIYTHTCVYIRKGPYVYVKEPSLSLSLSFSLVLSLFLFNICHMSFFFCPTHQSATHTSV